MAILLPRLPGPACEALVQSFLEQGPDRWLGFSPRNLPEAVRYAATGGSKISDNDLGRLRELLEDLARRHGFGGASLDRRTAFARFDAEVAACLAQESILDSGEALRDDVWSFVGAVLAPDIVYWRFDSAKARYAGGPRNTFQRLWMRGRTFDRGAEHPQRWQLLSALSEDAMVQIMERPSISGDRVLALAIAEAWVRASAHHGKTAMEAIMRRAMLRVRILNEIRSLPDLPDVELQRILDQAFDLPASTSRPESLAVTG